MRGRQLIGFDSSGFWPWRRSTEYSALLTLTHSHDISGPLAAIVGATLFVFGEAAWHNHRRARAVAFTGLAILASGISGLAVLARTSSMADERIQVQRTANLPRELAQKALDAAEAGVVAAEAAALARRLQRERIVDYAPSNR